MPSDWKRPPELITASNPVTNRTRPSAYSAATSSHAALHASTAAAFIGVAVSQKSEYVSG